jgi:hypothetical protein
MLVFLGSQVMSSHWENLTDSGKICDPREHLLVPDRDSRCSHNVGSLITRVSWLMALQVSCPYLTHGPLYIALFHDHDHDSLAVL